jgi:predicted ribosomally synthesized peptide with nif11-like leader
MSLDQLKSFLGRMRDDSAMREAVQAAATADDVAHVAATLGYAFSGDAAAIGAEGGPGHGDKAGHSR